MTASLLRLALPCRRCAAKPGDPSIKGDGTPTSRPHPGRTPLAPCGTNGGYARHVKSQETPCDSCREARRRYMATYRDRRPDVRESDIAGLRARHEATKRLIARHDSEFRQLLAQCREEAS